MRSWPTQSSTDSRSRQTSGVCCSSPELCERGYGFALVDEGCFFITVHGSETGSAKDSSNSSNPPSSDFVNSTKQKKKPGRPGKKRVGGQPGHKRQLREPLPPDRVDETIEYEIDDKEIDRLELMPTDRRDDSAYRAARHADLRDRTLPSTVRITRRQHLLAARSRAVRSTDFRASFAGDDRLDEITGPLQLHDHRRILRRCAEGAGVTRLPVEALHGRHLWFAGRRLRRSLACDSSATAIGQVHRRRPNNSRLRAHFGKLPRMPASVLSTERCMRQRKWPAGVIRLTA